MHFGWYVNPETSGAGNDRRHIQDTLEQCERAEQLGYSAIWLTEHHVTGYNTYSDCVLMATYLAGRTRTVKLGFAIAILALHHPVRFIEQCNLIDQLSNGRLIVGVGSGFGGIEFAPFNVDHTDRHAIFDKAADLLFEIWNHPAGVWEFDNGLHRGRIDGRIVPESVQQPHPLVARATTHADYAEAWGRRGQPIQFSAIAGTDIRGIRAAHRRGLAEAGLSSERIDEISEWSPIVMTVYVAESDEQAWREFTPALEQHVVSATLANTGRRITRADLDEKRKQETFNRAIVGSPETVAGRLRELGEWGFQHVMVWMNTGLLDHDLVLKSQSLFAERVIPQLASVRPLATV
jgi:alkanesulfonate monooxygenase SsuD/methylene tetrahydromethanopterin reductase-like flavin-dependent oxidoreductase (luciferase family)